MLQEVPKRNNRPLSFHTKRTAKKTKKLEAYTDMQADSKVIS
jgi:hypothetical protein